VTLRTALPLLDLAVAGGERIAGAVQWIVGRFRRWQNRQPSDGACQAAPLDAKPQVMNDPRSDTWDVHGVRIPMGPVMTAEVRRHMLRGSYELAEVRALWQTIRAGDRVLELGTGCGLLATYAAKVVGSAAVLTVEADPLLEQTIRHVFALNDVEPELVIGAVGKDASPRGLERAPDFWATRTTPLDPKAPPRLDLRVVAGVDFARLLEQHLPTIVVIDIEGGELEICGTALPAQVRAVIVETHGDACANAVALWLIDQGLRLAEHWVSSSPDVALWLRHDSPCSAS
jgi:FkbM family methyltransferase